ncbi:ParB/RepB/Spo0J family partition protein [Pedobacter sp. MC2016-24]|uniref:ParB/RepB/Spo0J family partition protein n=1 Tax=Pedobacter sp. MC2016-24 TaxID=2780090 RepID=UPI001880CDDC|nr:ParB/RepB/Spo0J family partition protein [Pedobacter sp. MC2016-24]MBE9598696.1 ParB/RepB/Spo0J family partition protein [Pedobacter sp. MC2016-24]
MNTATKKKAVKAQQQESTSANNAAPEINNQDSILTYLNLSDIDISPLNYRKVFNLKDLIEFAEGLILHGMISPMTVRQMETGRYEVVAGERRYRGAEIAKISVVPVMIRVLSDEQVKEIQLVENLQRENPHPMHESFAVLGMQQAGKSIDEIAARLGKSKTFVYSRIKLAGLIEVLQDIFLADKVTIQEAFDIAVLSPESQYEFYEQYCTNWQDDNFKLNNIRNILSRFKFDLLNAPFNTKDKKLVPEAGACTNCAFNSATIKSLFPEMATAANCNNHVCYQSKCKAQINMMVRLALAEHQPVALLHTGSFSTEIAEALESIPEAMALPQYSRYDVTIFSAPSMPDKEDYEGYYDEEEGEDPDFDEEGYNNAVQEYETDLTEYTALAQSDTILKGLQLNSKGGTLILFSTEKKEVIVGKSAVTAKEVQEAIKAGTITTELLDAEIERINTKEKRAKELDSEKIQIELHTQFNEAVKTSTLIPGLTPADHTAIRLFVYQSLDWQSRQAVDKVLFPAKDNGDNFTANEQKLAALANLTDEQFAFMTRSALAGRSDSKTAGYITAVCLYQVAKESGLDVAAIEQAQQAKATERQENIEVRVKDLEKRKARLGTKKAA